MAEELKGLPAALVQVGENDILHNEGVAYRRKLDDAGVPTTVTEYKGFMHDYGILNPLAHIQALQESVLDAATALRKALFVK
jgi:Esterase/lipase